MTASQQSRSVTGGSLSIPISADESAGTFSTQAIYSASMQAQGTSGSSAGPSDHLLGWSAYPGNAPRLPHPTPPFWRNEYPRMSYETMPVAFSFPNFPFCCFSYRGFQESHLGFGRINRASLPSLQSEVFPATPDPGAASLVPPFGLAFHEPTAYQTYAVLASETTTAYVQQPPNRGITSHAHARPVKTPPTIALLPSAPLPASDGGNSEANRSHSQRSAVSSGPFPAQSSMSHFDSPQVADFRTMLPTREYLGLLDPRPLLWMYPQQLPQQNQSAPEFTSGQGEYERNSYREQGFGRPAR
jgi:hypothetical protein